MGLCQNVWGEKNDILLTSSQEAAAATSALHLHKLTLWHLDQRRNWRRYAPVHERFYDNFRVQQAHIFQDVTTRGNYYPDKRMATAAVSNVGLPVSHEHTLILSRTLRFTSTSPAPPRKASNWLSRKLKR
jgi:hypothetical protein